MSHSYNVQKKARRFRKHRGENKSVVPIMTKKERNEKKRRK
jgi:hypothetical protein